MVKLQLSPAAYSVPRGFERLWFERLGFLSALVSIRGEDIPQKKEVAFEVTSFIYFSLSCSGRESNPYGHFCPQDFKSCVSTYSTTRAEKEIFSRTFYAGFPSLSVQR